MLKALVAVAALVSAGQLQAANLIQNGDFEAGMQGFSSDYTAVPSSQTGAASLWNEGTYTVGSDAHAYHGLWSAGADHTSGHGNYLIANGAASAGSDVWRSSQLTIGPGTYRFSLWLDNPNVDAGPDSQPHLDLLAEGYGSLVTLAALEDASSAGSWRQNEFTMTIGQTLTGRLALRDASTVTRGNDFGIDDISLTQISAVPEPASWAMMIGGFGLLGGMMRAARRSDERFTRRLRERANA